jgi:hypothetical protein
MKGPQNKKLNKIDINNPRNIVLIAGGGVNKTNHGSCLPRGFFGGFVNNFKEVFILQITNNFFFEEFVNENISNNRCYDSSTSQHPRRIPEIYFVNVKY